MKKQKQPNASRLFVVSRLNIKFWLRLVGIFLTLDIMLLGAVLVGTVIYAEQILDPVLQEFAVHHRGAFQSDSGEGSLFDDELPAATDRANYWIQISYRDGSPQGLEIPNELEAVLPASLVLGARKVVWDWDPDVSWWQQLDTLVYQVEVPMAENVGESDELSAHGSVVQIRLTLDPVIQMIKAVAVVLALTQLLYIVGSISAGAGMIRSTMGPLVELAERAQSLSSEDGARPYSPDEMDALAGKLEGINAARLDTRIDMDDSQDELKAVTGAINSMLDRIHASYRAQARFVSDASHELRTPIAAIQGYANLLDRWGKNDPQALEESIGAIKEEAANMKELVEQLLFLARGDNHTMPLQREAVDLGEIADVVLKESQMLDQGHEFHGITKRVPAVVDNGLIKQALRILVDNAIKYTPVGGKITIETESRDKRGWIIVQDEGIGIPAEAVPHIFDRFYRADESRARATGGTGLGLSIAKWIVERHGGQLEVISREGIGTRIAMVLPLGTDAKE